MKHFFNMLFIFMLTYSLAHADDTAFGGSGSTPMPIEKNEIRMIDEHIVINGNELDKENMQGEWKVSCDFTFKNMTDKVIALDVGFPFPIYEEEENITAPAGITPQKGGPLLYDFIVQVDGKKVDAQQKDIASNSSKGIYYKNAYIWKMTFAPHQIARVHHDYKTGVTFNVMGHSLVNYVLLTGGLWQSGTIDHAKLEVIPNTPTRLCSELENSESDYSKPKPDGVEIIGLGKNRKYIWNLKKLQPKEDLQVCLQTAKNYIRYSLVYPLVNHTGGDKLDLKKMDKSQLRILRNSIFAQYGRRFQSPELQDYFNKQWWYEPSNAYSDNMLTKEDKEAIKIIQNMD